MLLIQMTGLSGAGKTTLAGKGKHLPEHHSLKVEIIDGDVYRKTLCKDQPGSGQSWLLTDNSLHSFRDLPYNNSCYSIIINGTLPQSNKSL